MTALSDVPIINLASMGTMIAKVNIEANCKRLLHPLCQCLYG